MYKLFFLTSFFSFLFIACNDDETTKPPEEIVEQNFYALTDGNSWTYSVMQRLANNDYATLDLLITNTISGTEVVDGETYYTIQTTSEGEMSCSSCINSIGNMQVRDSLGYLVKRDGTILFSNENTQEYVISDNDWGTVYGVLLPNTISIETPAATFTALQNDRYAILANGEESEGRDRKLYNNEVGLVYHEIATVQNANPWYIITLESYTVH